MSRLQQSIAMRSGVWMLLHMRQVAAKCSRGIAGTATGLLTPLKFRSRENRRDLPGLRFSVDRRRSYTRKTLGAGELTGQRVITPNLLAGVVFDCQRRYSILASQRFSTVEREIHNNCRAREGVEAI